MSITFQFTGNSVTFLLNDNGNQYGVSIDGIPYTVFETKIGKIEYPYIIGYDEPGPHTVGGSWSLQFAGLIWMIDVVCPSSQC